MHQQISETMECSCPDCSPPSRLSRSPDVNYHHLLKLILTTLFHVYAHALTGNAGIIKNTWSKFCFYSCHHHASYLSSFCTFSILQLWTFMIIAAINVGLNHFNTVLYYYNYHSACRSIFTAGTHMNIDMFTITAKIVEVQ